jgi:hypothetical protein
MLRGLEPVPARGPARGLVVVVLVAGLVVVSSPAMAAGVPSGVRVDPGSPAAKEYAIPLSQARGGGGSGSGSLFGRGVTKAPTPAASTPAPVAVVGTGTKIASRHKRAAAHRRAAGRPRVRVPAGSVAEASPRHAASRVPPGGSVAGSGGGSGIVWMLGVAALVLALGGVGSVVVGRYSRRPSAGTS